MLAFIRMSAAVAVCLGCIAEAAAAQRIRIALQLPPDSHLYENLRLFKTVVEKRTQGALEIVIAHSGELMKEQDAPAAVGSGTIEWAPCRLTNTAWRFRPPRIFVEPFMFAFPPALTAATRPGSSVRTLIDAAILEKTGARVLWWQSNGVTIMVSRGEPLRTPAAIAGKKVRVTTHSEAEFIKLCGGVPMIIPGSRHYDAHKERQIDAGSLALSAAAVRKMWEA
ncbi:MAG: hypothetical protein ACREC6_12035 [Hyphomicrobiaceae bacterium]